MMQAGKGFSIQGTGREYAGNSKEVRGASGARCRVGTRLEGAHGAGWAPD